MLNIRRLDGALDNRYSKDGYNYQSSTLQTSTGIVIVNSVNSIVGSRLYTTL